MTDERNRSGTVADRQHGEPPNWAYWGLAMFAAFLIVAGASTYSVVQSRHASRTALAAAGTAAAVALDAQEQSDTNARILRQQDMEALERRDQICTAAEREHKKDVRSLRLTYRYLVGLTLKQRKAPINRLIIAQLGRTEETAQTDVAPRFCDRPGVGLPEPDPVIPKRPKSLR